MLLNTFILQKRIKIKYLFTKSKVFPRGFLILKRLRRFKLFNNKMLNVRIFFTLSRNDDNKVLYFR